MLELLSQYILPQYQEPQRPHKPMAKHILRLEENSPQALCKMVLLETEKRALVYKFDKGSGPNHSTLLQQRRLLFLNAMPGVEQMCDFIIFLENSPSQTFIILANLKSTKVGNNESQLKAGEIFTEFITQTILRCQNMTSDDHTFIFRRLLFMSHNIPKGRTKPSTHFYNEPHILPCGVTINLDVYC
jgi:hypothetical protein